MDVTITKEERKKRSYLPLGCRRNCCWICKSHRASVCVCVCVHNHFPLLMMDQDELFGVCHFWLSLRRMKAPPLRRWPVNRKKVNDKSEQVEWRIWIVACTIESLQSLRGDRACIIFSSSFFSLDGGVGRGVTIFTKHIALVALWSYGLSLETSQGSEIRLPAFQRRLYTSLFVGSRTFASPPEFTFFLFDKLSSHIYFEQKVWMDES